MITTSSDIESSSCLDIEDLTKTNAIVGCDMEDSIMLQNLVEVIGFQRKNIKHIAQSSFDDFAKALSTGNIKAAFFWTPYAEVFLAKYCKGFKSWGPNQAMVRLWGSGKFKRMKDDLLSFPECSSSTIDVTMKRGIGPGPFSGLFILSGTVSAVAILITVIRPMRRGWERLVQGMLMGRGLWALKALFLYISSSDLIDGYGTPASWIVTSYEIAFVGEINTFTRRAKANVPCALPANDKTTMGNESSTSYMSRQMYEIGSLIGNYLGLKPGTSVHEESDRISSDLDIVNFNLNNRNPNSKTGGIIQMTATLLFSTSKSLHYYTELSIAVPVRSIPSQFLNISHDDKSHNEAQITGFWIDLFKEAIAVMPINTTYKLVPFYGSDDQLFETPARRVSL
ncbi:hypothetical protein Gohar_018223 [Gossypium harknessii]|uniref:Ionotropic glutamate receptor C-terminal domain-containing protein n=1 Tax=Gossypium harknessii TaxID=34285 RepID=A0A7J9G8M3_9ROSI|nr:hypothetical protein [Gossypium harknessii]